MLEPSPEGNSSNGVCSVLGFELPHRQFMEATMGVETAVQTIGEHAHGKYVPVLGQICKCNVRRPFSYHQVRRDQALEDDRPCRVMEPVLERPEDFAYASLARMCRYQNMLDVLGFWRCCLQRNPVSMFQSKARLRSARTSGD